MISPLNWLAGFLKDSFNTDIAALRAVITGKDTEYNNVSDLRGKPIGVSRLGSGSHIFASYMALREKWYKPETQEVQPLEFKGAVSLQACVVVELTQPPRSQ